MDKTFTLFQSVLLALVICAFVVKCTEDSDRSIAITTLANLTISEGETYSIECRRQSTAYFLQFVKFKIFTELGSSSSSWEGPFVLSNQTTLEEAMENDGRYSVEEKTELYFVLTLTDVKWQDQAIFGCRAYTDDVEYQVTQKVHIPGPLTDVEFLIPDPLNIELGTPVSEQEIRVRDSDPLVEYSCRVRVSNTLPPAGFSIKMNGQFTDLDTLNPRVYTNSGFSDARYTDDSYSLLSYHFDETKRDKNAKSVYTCTLPLPDGGELNDTFTVALEYAPEYKNEDERCSQEKEVNDQSGLDNYILTCRIMAYPFATPLWVDDQGEFINETVTPEKYDIYHSGPFNDAEYSLRIYNVTEGDIGKLFKFQAINTVNFSPQQWIKLDANAPYIGKGNILSCSYLLATVLSILVLFVR